ncbi:hypothetical protein ACO0K0_12070 [Undibacterium sp. SXout11W]|uniref:hypothetical protein n=1 Tax=Undibacterium sp. SXout11W TaxID=3413050 RepID=UPI003BF438B7
MDKYKKTAITDDDIPEWDTTMGSIWIAEVLTPENRKFLLESKEHIWPRNFSNDEKNALLDTANTALNFWKLRNENAKNRPTPKEQRAQLNELVDSIKKLKGQLAKLEGEPLTHSDLSFLNARYLTNPPFDLWLKDEYGAHIGSLLTRTWLHLDDSQRVLMAAANRIHVDVSYRPENHLNDCIVTELASQWKQQNGKYPPRSKTGWFAKFVVELGSTINLTLSPELTKRCIDSMEEVDKSFTEDMAIIKKSS